MIGHLYAACVFALVDYYVLFCFFRSEEKSDEVTNLLGEVRSVLYLLTCLVSEIVSCVMMCDVSLQAQYPGGGRTVWICGAVCVWPV